MNPQNQVPKSLEVRGSQSPESVLKRCLERSKYKGGWFLVAFVFVETFLQTFHNVTVGRSGLIVCSLTTPTEKDLLAKLPKAGFCRPVQGYIPIL